MLMIIFLFPTLKSIFGCWRSWCCCCCCMWNSFSKITVEFAGWLLPPWGLPNERCDELNCDYFCRQRDGQREQKSRKLCCSSRFLVSFHTHLNLESSFCVFFCCLLACFCFNFWSCPGMARESEEGKTSQTKLHQRLSRARTALTRGLSVLLYFFSSYSNNCFHFDRTTTTNSRQAAAERVHWSDESRERMPRKSPNDGEMWNGREKDFTDTFLTHILNISEIRSAVSTSHFILSESSRGRARFTHVHLFLASWCERWTDFPAPN